MNQCIVPHVLAVKQVIVDDKALKQRILALYYGTRLGSHFRLYRMIGSLSTHYYWPWMATDICNYCKSCQTCQPYKVVIHARQGQLQPSPVPEYCWQHATIDLITCLPKTNRGVDAITTFLDYLIKYTYLVPVTTFISGDNLAQIFL